MKKLWSLIFSLIGMVIILYSIIFLSGMRQELIDLLGVLFALAGTIFALWSEELNRELQWLLRANVVLFAVAVIAAIIKVAAHA